MSSVVSPFFFFSTKRTRLEEFVYSSSNPFVWGLRTLSKIRSRKQNFALDEEEKDEIEAIPTESMKIQLLIRYYDYYSRST